MHFVHMEYGCSLDGWMDGLVIDDYFHGKIDSEYAIKNNYSL